TARDEGEAPGGPFGMTMVGDELLVVIGTGENENDRYICRFIPGHGFKSDRLACPDLTGAQLAFDGETVFLSQAHYRKIVALDAQGRITREIPLDRIPLGMTIARGSFYLITSDAEFENLEFASLDPGEQAPRLVALAGIPFDARGLSYDGAQFWTSHRDDNQIVAFTP
ncbi:MAG TPA: hypothetical protein VIO32_02795, partial [Candidatus Baltobacteraceae bacterium]